MTKQIKQYGTWSSPVSPDMLAESLRFNDVQWDTDGQTLVWAENRGKLGILVAQRGINAARDLIDSRLSVKGGVGYGGGEFTVADGIAYFACSDGRLYRISIEGGEARPITPAFGAVASPAVSSDGKWVAFVHTYENDDCLAVVDTNGTIWPRKLFSGTDFVMQATWNPDGNLLAFVTWDHPNMPWDGTELRLATIAYDHDGIPYLETVDTITGDKDTAIFQPEFSPDGRYLSYISDETGYGQIYIYDRQEHKHTLITNTEAEHGTPAWIQGLHKYSWNADGSCLNFIRNSEGFNTLHSYSIESGEETQNLDLRHYTEMKQVTISKTGIIALIGSASTIPTRIISFDDRADGIRIHKRSTTESILPDQLSEAQAITWTGHDGGTAHGLYYAPISEKYEGIGAPPLIVHVHGGPTSQSVADYNDGAQFFATRGYAVLRVNHRGGTGYGREDMLMLRGNWGIYDVEDSASGAQYLADQGLADPGRLIIMGGSAGGYTVLQSLVDKPGFYKAAICLYGVSNQFLLAQDTHKFESHYTDTLLGSLPEAADVYRERSPFFHADKIVDPIIVFQGADDPVVPQNQSDSIVKSLQSRGVPHEYHIYEGEGHGFRKPETIKHYYDAILTFLGQHLL
jgi:dipeptidyl aminopeptidase/acylaminoacyl peptidase